MAQASGDPVAAIAEGDATGHVKLLYDDIKAVSGVPVVNLIFRHLATLPGCLDWSWQVLRPLYASGVVDAATARLMAGLPLPAVPPLPRAALRAVGVAAQDEQTIRRILDAYNRSNPMNLLALTTLLSILQDTEPRASVPRINPGIPRATAPQSSRTTPLPPLLALDDMQVTTATLVRTLNGLSPQGEARTMASMYRQLAHWPGYLALALALLTPLHSNGSLQRAASHASAQAFGLARGLRDSLHRENLPPRPAADACHALGVALHYFTAHLIVEMLPVGHLLRLTLPKEEQ